ncbi:MAG: hypothetical protein AMJ93_09755 [Anaerolineae bacterium SM23_84]|nr:MAG: hypothetical protein AMJ93_09755 [Anaerolineae bacterium SM23_84]
MEMRKFRMMVALALGSGLLALVMTALLVVSAPSISHASPLDQVGNPCGYGFQIDVVPPLPTTNDTVSVTYSAEWPHLPTPEHQSHEIVGNVIRLDAVYYAPEIVLPVIAGWGGEAGVGNLPSGTYTVQVYLTTVMTPTVFPPELCGTQSFTVYEELQREPEDLYVAPTGTDAGNCTNSDSPCETVQYAVDQASEGSTIKVASGTYTDVHAHPSNGTGNLHHGRPFSRLRANHKPHNRGAAHYRWRHCSSERPSGMLSRRWDLCYRRRCDHQE